MCELYALPGVEQQCPLDQMKQGYFGRTGNGVVPQGPERYLELLRDPTLGAGRAEALKAVR
jgi:hypothetical protein